MCLSNEVTDHRNSVFIDTSNRYTIPPKLVYFKPMKITGGEITRTSGYMGLRTPTVHNVVCVHITSLEKIRFLRVQNDLNQKSNMFQNVK